MREIKFRAWDTILKMWTNYRIEDDMIYIMVKTAGTWIRHDVRNDWRFQLMQFTWLKDKNGKEIFEWDIVEELVGPHRWVSEIIFMNGCFRKALRYRNFDRPNEIDETIFWDHYFQWTEWWAWTLEYLFWIVIWNIYENPELITK